MDLRTEKSTYFLDLAERCAKQGTCQRRNYGAVIVDEDGTIVSTGYTGTPSGIPHCQKYGMCWREKNNIPSGSNYNKCRSVHAEMNALIQAGKDARNSTLYISGVDAKTGETVETHPCFLCMKMILNAKIKEIVIRLPEGLSLNIDPEEEYKRLEEKELGVLELESLD